MRHLFSSSLIALALVVSALGAYAPAAHAETSCPPNTTQDLSGDGLCHGSFDANNNPTDAGVAPTETGTGLTQTTVDQAAANTPVTLPAPPASIEGFGPVMTYIMSLFAWLVGVAAITLDNAVYYTVVTMGSYVSHLSAVGVTWRILRDIGNILLIFGFLAVGVTTILNVDWYGDRKKMLPMMFVAAVFLNFSLFISEAFIDVSNLFATQFYTQINGGAPAAPMGYFSGQISKEGISNKIMAQLGLQTIYTEGRVNMKVFEAGNTWVIGFMGIILFIVTAFVLFSLAFVLIARFIILLLLIILSPAAFAGLAIPGLNRRMKQWWDKLFEQVMTAPILLLMLYIALAIITDANFLTGFCIPGSTGTLGDPNTNMTCTANAVGWVSGNFQGFASFILSFLVAMGLLIAVVIQSKNLSAFGGDWASKMGGRLSFGAVSLAGRATLGSAGNLLAGKRMQSAARRGGVSGFLLKTAVLGGKGLRSTTYDVRNAPGAAVGFGKIGVEAGKGATLTAKQVHEAQYGWKPTKEWLDQSKAEREQAGREMDFKDAQANFAAGRITQAQHDAIVGPILSKMTTKQLEELGGIKNGVDALVNNLSPQQFEALMKSEKLNDIEKGKIKDARYRSLTTAVNSGNIPNIKKAVNSLSKGELESMPATTLTNPLVLDQLSDKQRETITDSKERTAAEKDLVRKSSPGGSVENIFNTAGGGVAGAATVAGSPNFARLTVPQLAKLDKAILTQPLVAEKLTTATLIELQEQKKLTPAEMIDIGNHIRASATANMKTKEYVSIGPGAALWS